jgi:hypothetical protein
VPRAEWVVGDRQGHVTLECSKHAEMILGVGAAWAIPISSLCVVTAPEDIAALIVELASTEDVETLVDRGCPTYVAGLTIDADSPERR